MLVLGSEFLGAVGLLVEFLAEALDGCQRDPVACPDLYATVLPLVHPSYREVWIGRLGYDYPEYVAAIRERLDTILADS